MRAKEAALVDALLEAKLKSVKDADDVLYHLHPKCFISTRQDLFEQTVEWLKTQPGIEAEDFVRTEIAAARLREYVKDLLKKKGELAVPAFLELDTTPGISAKGWKGRKE